MEEITIREPEQIRQDCAKKLRVVRGPRLRAVLGYFLGEEWAIPTIAHLRLTADGCVVALVNGEHIIGECRGELIRSIHCIARRRALVATSWAISWPRSPRSSERYCHEIVPLGNPARRQYRDRGRLRSLTEPKGGRVGPSSKLQSARRVRCNTGQIAWRPSPWRRPPRFLAGQSLPTSPYIPWPPWRLWRPQWEPPHPLFLTGGYFQHPTEVV